MTYHQLPTSIENRFLSLIGVGAFCYIILLASPITFFSRLTSTDQSYYFLQFERDFWQFLFSFIAVIVLSRGHLWSYGINSQNLATSMKWLAWLYGFIILITGMTIVLGKEFLPVDVSNIPSNAEESIIAILVYWMSSPVANQILFFSFGQTILMKQWGTEKNIFGIPLFILFSSALFTVGATSSAFSIGVYAAVPTCFLGIFCSIIYWKTNSLIAPMLGHAFYFGFPLFIHILRTSILR